MKHLNLAALALLIALYSTAAVAQHAHGGMGGGMSSSSIGHASMGDSSSSHGPNDVSGHSGNSTSHKATVGEILGKNPAIGDKIQSLTGMPAEQACAGFKNLGQCVAAAHVSKNLDISFDCLKADMTGTAPTSSTCPSGTGSKSMSLGKAIQTLDPKADAGAESRKAQNEAQEDLKGPTSRS